MRIPSKDERLGRLASDDSTTAGGADESSPCSSPGSPLAAAHELGIYIVYLEPEGALAEKIARAREFLGAQFGRDEAFQYPLHCSLTGFFEISTFNGDCPKRSVAASIHEAIHAFISRFSDPKSHLLYDYQGLSALDPDRAQNNVSAYNEDLDWIKLSKDGGLFLPLPSHWFEEHLPALRELLTDNLQTLAPLQIQSRRGCQGIQLKRADHVSFLDGKSRRRTLPQAFRAAQFIDDVFKSAANPQLHWDLVVYELEEWGVGAPDDFSPHRMSEVVRVPRVVVQHLLTEQ